MEKKGQKGKEPAGCRRYVDKVTAGRRILFEQGAGAALFGAEDLFCGEIDLADDRIGSLQEIGLACVSEVVANQLQGAVLPRGKHVHALCAMQGDFVKVHRLTPQTRDIIRNIPCCVHRQSNYARASKPDAPATRLFLEALEAFFIALQRPASEQRALPDVDHGESRIRREEQSLPLFREDFDTLFLNRAPNGTPPQAGAPVPDGIGDDGPNHQHKQNCESKSRSH
jgi:hypothetical protein